MGGRDLYADAAAYRWLASRIIAAGRPSGGVTIQPMRHGLIILLITTATLISALAVRNNIRETARRKREIGYTVALKAYSQALHPGMTRKDVEGYLRSRNTQFTWIYTAFGGRRKSQYADVVKIGEEAAPWYCSEAYVHIALEFSPVKDFRQTDSDVLQRIEIYSRATLPVLQRLLDDKLAQIQYDAVIGIAQYAMSFPVSTVASKPTDMATFTPPKSVTDEMRLHYPSQGLFAQNPQEYISFWKTWLSAQPATN